MDELREVIAKALWASEFRPLSDGEWDQAKASVLGPSCFRQADVMLAAIGETHVVLPLSWIAERRLEAWNMRQRVPGPYDQGFWDGCEAQLVELLIDCGGMEEEDVPPIRPDADERVTTEGA